MNAKYEQMSFLPKDDSVIPERADCCNNCTYFSALRDPRQRYDGATIYGYCFRDGDTNYSPNMGKGFAVFISPQSGRCKKFKSET